MHGWHGKLLRIDLTTHKTWVEEIDLDSARDFIGGRGLAVKYMYSEVDPKIDPYDPGNHLIFSTGPLTATPAPTGNRYMVMTKAPLTGALANSNAGGFFPTEMKRTGYDLYIFMGKSEQPVYLWISDKGVEIRSAEHVWGKSVPETEDILLAETDPKARVACIGIAGENRLRMAGIMNDKHRAAGRSGVGAVMGSKNLKAVVVRGETNPTLADPEQMVSYSSMIQKEVATASNKPSAMRMYGTSYVPPITNEIGILPTRNFQTGTFEGIDGIHPEVLKNNYLIRPKACYRCPIACGRMTKVDDPKYGGEGEGPEYETIASIGSACGISNLAAITKANYLCNEYGMDTISIGMTIAAAMEMYEKGIIPVEDIGMPLNFGDADALIELVKQAATRTGFGNLIAEGSYRLAEHYGHPEFSMTAKKQEFPGYDPRGAKGMGLLYATSNKGASHMSGDLAYAEVFGTPKKIDNLTIVGKPALIKRFEDAFAVIDAAGLCVFLSVRYYFGEDVNLWPVRLTQIMNYATGAGYTEETLLQAGERIFNLERMFLIEAGFTRADDTIPKRFLEEPLTAGGAKGHVCELDQMLPEFYKLRGWDEAGVPTTEKLVELKLA